MLIRRNGRKQTVNMPKKLKKECLCRKPVNRRPIRPIDRQKMRPWLEDLLNREIVTGLYWENKADQIFVVSWRHAARHGWKEENDADIFLRWAKHTGKFQNGDTSDPKHWKANFRCALHSLGDVRRLPSETKGCKAQRRFQFLDCSEAKSKSRKTKKQVKKEEVEYSDSSSASDMDNTSSDTETTLPKFNLLMGGSVSQSFTKLNSGCRVTVTSPPELEKPIFTPFTISSSLSENSESSTGSDFSEEEVMDIVDHISTMNPDLLDYSFFPQNWPEPVESAVIVEEVVTSSNNTEECGDILELTAMAKSNFL